jgi:hypothetical protein
METNRPSRHLQKAARARERRDTVCVNAAADYVRSIRAAVAAGHSLTEIGDATGTSKQAIWNLLNTWEVEA